MKSYLVSFDQIKACGIEIDNSKEIAITLIPLCESKGNERQKEIVNSLNHASYMVDYLYTILMYTKKNADKESEASELIDKMQEYLVKLGYTITYRQPLLLTDDIWKPDKIHVSYAISSLNSLDDVKKILDNIESLSDYIHNHTWVVVK